MALLGHQLAILRAVIPPKQVAQAYVRAFGVEPQALCAAPGRVNLIGEHIDYAGGCVLPLSIRQGVSCAAGPGEAGWIEAASDLFPGPTYRISLSGTDPGDPPFAPLLRVLAAETRASGLRMLFASDLPPGKGQSSSAAFCVSAAAAMLALVSEAPRWSAFELAQACQRAEQLGLGVPCGLMDQFASVFGRPGQAILFDTQDLSHQYINLPAPGAHLLLVDSGQPRQLASSGYAQRRHEMEAGLDELASRRPGAGGIRDSDTSALLHAIAGLPAPLDRRLRHAATEQMRVLHFAEALPGGDLPYLGQLLTASHNSLSEDYEVSTPEIDRLCDLLTNCPGVYGARLVGGGFGGSVLALASAGAGSCIAEALAEYKLATRLDASFSAVQNGAGAAIADPRSGKLIPLVEWLG